MNLTIQKDDSQIALCVKTGQSLVLLVEQLSIQKTIDTPLQLKFLSIVSLN